MLKANPETVLKEVTINQKYPHLANVLTLNSKSQAAYEEHTCKHTHTDRQRHIRCCCGKKVLGRTPPQQESVLHKKSFQRVRPRTFNFYFNFCLI